MSALYLNLGQDYSIREQQVIGIFDMDTSTISKHTRDFLRRAEQDHQVVNTTRELPKSFVLYGEKDTKVALSQFNPHTLKKRLGVQQLNHHNGE